MTKVTYKNKSPSIYNIEILALSISRAFISPNNDIISDLAYDAQYIICDRSRHDNFYMTSCEIKSAIAEVLKTNGFNEELERYENL